MVALKFKQKFIDKYSALTNFEEYKTSLKKFRRKSLLINTLKASISHVKNVLSDDGWVLEQVPWCENGFYITHESGRRDIGNTRAHKDGLIFVMSSVSMIPTLALQPTPRDVVLDMCAAPGGKTVHLAMIMKNRGRIVANDRDPGRLGRLKINLERCGVKNVEVRRQNGVEFSSPEVFDKILLDAPCSSSGRIKGKTAESKDLLLRWNPLVIEKCSRIQKKLVETAFHHLKPGGSLVYSTCSLEPEEDEDVMEWCVENLPCEVEKIGLPVKSSSQKYVKVWPQYYDTFGFFVAKLRKKE